MEDCGAGAVRAIIHPNVDALLDRLRTMDVSDLIPRLWPGARSRIAAGTLVVSELVVSAMWLGLDPVELWSEHRSESLVARLA